MKIRSLIILLVVVCGAITNAAAQLMQTYHSKDFTFKIYADSTVPGPRSWKFRIEVYPVNSTTPSQTITGDLYERYYLTGAKKDELFIIEDANFDGYDDIRLLKPAAGAIYWYYLFWIFDPVTRTFKEPDNPGYDVLNFPKFDHKEKTVSTIDDNYFPTRYARTYRLNGDKFLLIKEVEENRESKAVITRVLKGGKMVETGRKGLKEKKAKKVKVAGVVEEGVPGSGR